jgi:hypothetical protein
MWVLRATYLLMVVGLGLMIGPLLLRSQAGVEHFKGVVRCVLAAVAILALLGLRYPLKLLPLLFFELIWKTLWVALVGVPLWRAGQLTGEFAETMFNNLLGLIIFPLAVPWGYVLRHYLRAPADRGGAVVGPGARLDGG